MNFIVFIVCWLLNKSICFELGITIWTLNKKKILFENDVVHTINYHYITSFDICRVFWYYCVFQMSWISSNYPLFFSIKRKEGINTQGKKMKFHWPYALFEEDENKKSEKKTKNTISFNVPCQKLINIQYLLQLLIWVYSFLRV